MEQTLKSIYLKILPIASELRVVEGRSQALPVCMLALVLDWLAPSSGSRHVELCDLISDSWNEQHMEVVNLCRKRCPLMALAMLLQQSTFSRAVLATMGVLGEVTH